MVSIQVRPTQRAVAHLRVRLVAIGLAFLTGIVLIGAGVATIGLADSRAVRLGAMGLLLVGVFLVLVSVVRLRRAPAR
ncbi:hypothetical protein [Herbiconiux sp.]|uniref:hypothetical protein n=1 Tax=Herbiconiux sp. TaxID=1871186 RepID=UPI0025C58519|nr:hypothetical protein [Herbiconiux sp.]